MRAGGERKEAQEQQSQQKQLHLQIIRNAAASIYAGQAGDWQHVWFIFAIVHPPITRKHDCTRLPVSAERTHGGLEVYLAAEAAYKPKQNVCVRRGAAPAVPIISITRCLFSTVCDDDTNGCQYADSWRQIASTVFPPKEAKVHD